MNQLEKPCPNHRGNPGKTPSGGQRFRCKKCGWYRYPTNAEQVAFDIDKFGKKRERKYVNQI